jgi:hypothetical protein
VHLQLPWWMVLRTVESATFELFLFSLGPSLRTLHSFNTHIVNTHLINSCLPNIVIVST